MRNAKTLIMRTEFASFALLEVRGLSQWAPMILILTAWEANVNRDVNQQVAQGAVATIGGRTSNRNEQLNR